MPKEIIMPQHQTCDVCTFPHRRRLLGGELWCPSCGSLQHEGQPTSVPVGHIIAVRMCRHVDAVEWDRESAQLVSEQTWDPSQPKEQREHRAAMIRGAFKMYRTLDA